jgi:lipopolysaccharide transport system ATP-binding protein
MTHILEVEKLSKSFAAAGGQVWVLADISFQLAAGQSLGILGPNGAGKSTLLKILAGIYRPSAGRAILRGRVGAVLELGAGFHPDLSGRENILFAGQLAGMSRRQMRALTEEIIAFSELEEQLDKPLRHYSSGMYLRLAFATIIHIERDLLLLDEILSVGDAAFQQKCLQKLTALQQQGCSLLIVSHDLSTLQQLCARSMVIAGGRLAYEGSTAEALAYYGSHYGYEGQQTFAHSRFLSAGIARCSPAEDADQPLLIEISLCRRPWERTPEALAVALTDARNTLLFSAHIAAADLAETDCRLRWEIPPGHLNGGHYWINLYMIDQQQPVEYFPKIGSFALPHPSAPQRQLAARFHALHIDTQLYTV